MRTSLRTPRGVITAAAVVAALAAGTAGGIALADDSPIKALAPHAQASAQINADGTRAQSQGIKSSTRAATGIYCVTFDDATRINVSRSTPVATLVTSGGPQYAINLRTSPSPECGDAANTLTVYTGERNLLVDAPFMLLVP
ncbi:hypothetical protein AB0D94_22475 [Streptomyces sp. NPDC048255]|uniref:hypothetical protein n=1 Tax=Streptomyces sp. NPDC048255 TaxID=3154713 RepID=UPI0033E5182D